MQQPHQPQMHQPPPQGLQQQLCWLCGKGTMQDQGRPPEARFRCSFFPFCGGHRQNAWRQEPVILQLRGERMDRVAVTFPERTAEFDANFVRGKMRRLQLAQHEPVIRKVCLYAWVGAGCMFVWMFMGSGRITIQSTHPTLPQLDSSFPTPFSPPNTHTHTQTPDGPGWEALFDQRHYEEVLTRLRARDSGIDVARDVPKWTLDAVRVLLAGADGNFYADAGEVERRLATLPPRLAGGIFSFQRDGVRFALERNGRCLIADEVRACVRWIVSMSSDCIAV
jgi:hypothetical protein